MKQLFRSGLSKLPKHSSFEYKPRYYDERKERLEKREEEIRNMMEADKESGREKIEFNFRRNQTHAHRSKELMRSNIRLIVIMFGLVAIFYYLFFKADLFSQLISR